MSYSAKIDAAIGDIGDRIREERAAGDRFPLGSTAAARHGGLRDGLKQALDLIAHRSQETTNFYPPLDEAYGRVKAELALVKGDPLGTRVAVKADDLFAVVGNLELLRTALTALASGKADLVSAAPKPGTIADVWPGRGRGLDTAELKRAPRLKADLSPSELEAGKRWRESLERGRAALDAYAEAHDMPGTPDRANDEWLALLLHDLATYAQARGLKWTAILDASVRPAHEPQRPADPDPDPRFQIAHDSLNNPTLAVIRKHEITDGDLKTATYHLSHAMRLYLRGPERMARWWESREIWELTEEWARLWRRKGFPEWKNGDVAGDLEKLHRAIIADADGVAT